MGSASSKLRKNLQAGEEVQALQLYKSNGELRKVLDPNCSYGDSHQHETPLHLAAKHGMLTLLKIFLFSKGGNPNKTNARKETCLHCVCIENNAESVHVSNRRTECLNNLLKWRGATLSEGNVEKVDLEAQDDKLNTALHYAAASGLEQCVEILVKNKASLFVENEDNLTPCDTAEGSGHARIALYLESKMVFSNEDESLDDLDDVSMPPVEEYSGLRPQDLQEAKDQLLVETADMLSVPLFTAEALLRNHEWSRETLLEAWMSDARACCTTCGVTPPTSLFSDTPLVQEHLAEPLSSCTPSPLGAEPMPLDAECSICAFTFLVAEEPVHMSCDHSFCKECWERYLNVKIQEGDAHHITCPAHECCMLVPVEVIEGVVSRDMARRYLQFDIKAFVDSNPDMKWCPSPGCGRAVKLPDIDPGGHGGQGRRSPRSRIPSDTSRAVDCGVGHYFCWECIDASHEPCSCANWRVWGVKCQDLEPDTLDGTAQETELAANCLWLVSNSKPCPNCKSPIQKNEGCNHMKCGKCKYDFCWVCLEQWKRHNSSTGGYFKCNRFEVVKKVEEDTHSALTEAEDKNKKMQEMSRFVHYYTRFKNHENSYKFEEPLLKTAKDKMMKLAEAVTDIEWTASAETRFVEDAVHQLLKARLVLKASYVYGFYLDGPGYKRIVFEFMQTELEECTEILSQMVNRLYLRTPRRKITEQTSVVQRKRLEFISAIAKGLVPPETPPAVRKARKKKKLSKEPVDEDLHRAIMASIQESDPSNPWIKDSSGRHTNVAALLEWPTDDSDDSDMEGSGIKQIGKCHRDTCNRVKARNPRNSEMHDYCSRWCMLQDRQAPHSEELGVPEVDEHMELLRALEMSRLQYLRDSGMLGADSTHTSVPGVEHPGRVSAMDQLGIELQRFQELTQPTLGNVDQEEAPSSRSKKPRPRKLSQSSRFNESRSTVVTRVPNRSVEDLAWVDQGARGLPAPGCHALPARSPKVDESPLTPDLPDLCDLLASLPSPPSDPPSEPHDPTLTSPMTPVASCARQSLHLLGSMFGAIKDLSVSNIHLREEDKTKDFLHKDLASMFSSWDANHHTDHKDSPQTAALDGCYSYSVPPQAVSSRKGKASNKVRPKKKLVAECMKADGNVSDRKLEPPSPLSPSNILRPANLYFDHKNPEEVSAYLPSSSSVLDDSCQDNLSSETRQTSLLEMAENLLQMTADVHAKMAEVDEGMRSLGIHHHGDLEGTHNLVDDLHNSVCASNVSRRIGGLSDSLGDQKSIDNNVPLRKMCWNDTLEDGRTMDVLGVDAGRTMSADDLTQNSDAEEVKSNVCQPQVSLIDNPEVPSKSNFSSLDQHDDSSLLAFGKENFKPNEAVTECNRTTQDSLVSEEASEKDDTYGSFDDLYIGMDDFNPFRNVTSFKKDDADSTNVKPPNLSCDKNIIQYSLVRNISSGELNPPSHSNTSSPLDLTIQNYASKLCESNANSNFVKVDHKDESYVKHLSFGQGDNISRNVNTSCANPNHSSASLGAEGNLEVRTSRSVQPELKVSKSDVNDTGGDDMYV